MDPYSTGAFVVAGLVIQKIGDYVWDVMSHSDHEDIEGPQLDQENPIAANEVVLNPPDVNVPDYQHSVTETTRSAPELLHLDSEEQTLGVFPSLETACRNIQNVGMNVAGRGQHFAYQLDHEAQPAYTSSSQGTIFQDAPPQQPPILLDIGQLSYTAVKKQKRTRAISEEGGTTAEVERISNAQSQTKAKRTRASSPAVNVRSQHVQIPRTRSQSVGEPGGGTRYGSASRRDNEESDSDNETN